MPVIYILNFCILNQYLNLLREYLSSDSHIKKAKTILEENDIRLIQAVHEKFRGLEFYLKSGMSVFDEMDITENHFDDLSIVGLGESECTIAFDA